MDRTLIGTQWRGWHLLGASRFSRLRMRSQQVGPSPIQRANRAHVAGKTPLENKIGDSFQNERGISFQNAKPERRGRLPKLLMLYIDPPQGATWRSGYATVCKTVYTSSILVVASINIINALR